jgi:2-hydroxychromene-2-carboxylate isomerase
MAAEAIDWFHHAGDPYCALAVQLLAPLEARYGVAVRPHLVGPPAADAAPEPERLAAWSLRDAARLARAHGLAFPADPRPPAPERVVSAERALAAAVGDVARFAATATAWTPALWGDAPPPPAAPEVDPADSLAAGNAALAAAGHYLPAVFAYAGETFWGLDRMPHLEARLAARRDTAGARPGPPIIRQLEAGAQSGRADQVPLHFFLSFRSPYTWLALPRVRAVAERTGAALVLRPVLPMVMRGLPVPPAKRLAIVRDAKREADRLGLPFGPMHDPVGLGVERGLAVLHRAIAQGCGPAFAESFLKGAFAEAIDATTDEGLHRIADRAGLTPADVAAALADDGWRAVAEANRESLFALGLWGVPAFQVADRPAHWGQDRLWAVEEDLIAEAAGA